MYVRAGLFSGMLISIAALVLLGTSAGIGLCGGSLSKMAYLSKASACGMMIAGQLIDKIY